MSVHAKPSDMSDSMDLTNLLKQYSSSKNIEAAAESDDNDAMESLVTMMMNEVVKSMDEDSLVTLMGVDQDDDEALAQFRFFRRIIRKAKNFIRRSPVARRIINRVRSLLCSGKK